MSVFKKLGAFLLILAAFQLSCTKLQRQPNEEGALPVVRLSQPNSIPSDWGKLVSTTVSSDTSPSVMFLWFQNESGDIHLVSYDVSKNKLNLDAAVIARN
jgi:hypothetical protein